MCYVSKCTHSMCFSRGRKLHPNITSPALRRVTCVFTRRECFTVDKSSWHNSLHNSYGRVREFSVSLSNRVSRWRRCRRVASTWERDNPSGMTAVRWLLLFRKISSTPDETDECYSEHSFSRIQPRVWNPGSVYALKIKGWGELKRLKILPIR